MRGGIIQELGGGFLRNQHLYLSGPELATIFVKKFEAHLED